LAVNPAHRRGGSRPKTAREADIRLNTNHHLSKPAMIGKLNSSGTFDVVWRSINPIKASVWSRHLPDSAKRTADWTFPRRLRRMCRADIQGLVIG
jgi:urea transport system substrate-binding protein